MKSTVQSEARDLSVDSCVTKWDSGSNKAPRSYLFFELFPFQESFQPQVHQALGHD